MMGNLVMENLVMETGVFGAGTLDLVIQTKRPGVHQTVSGDSDEQTWCSLNLNQHDPSFSVNSKTVH